MKPALYLSLAVSLTACYAQLGFAIRQVPFGAINGRVIDPAHAVINDATITIRNKQTGIQRIATTERDGLYQVENLDPSEYEMEVARQGFATALYGLTLRAGDHLTVNFQLEIGQVSESVVVNGQISGVNTTDFAINGSVSRLQIEGLPLNGRNFLELARLEPGVSVTSVANPGAFGNNYNGSR